MIRVLNFFFVALMGVSILALYHVSERTHVARAELAQAEKRIAAERTEMSVLQTQWGMVSRPDRIQQLAQASLGMNDTATVQLSSLQLLPPRGGDNAPVGGERVREASAQVPAPAPAELVQIAAHTGT